MDRIKGHLREPLPVPGLKRQEQRVVNSTKRELLERATGLEQWHSGEEYSHC